MSTKRKGKRAHRTRAPREIEITHRHFPRVAGGIEIQGHILNEAQVAQYTKYADERLKFFMDEGDTYIEALNLAHDDALTSVLCRHAPALKIQDRVRLPGLSEVMLAIGHMGKLYFNVRSPTNKAAGIMLRSLVEKAQCRLAQLHHLAESLILQESTKLQDWTAREAEYQRLGEDPTAGA